MTAMCFETMGPLRSTGGSRPLLDQLRLSAQTTLPMPARGYIGILQRARMTLRAGIGEACFTAGLRQRQPRCHRLLTNSTADDSARLLYRASPLHDQRGIHRLCSVALLLCPLSPTLLARRAATFVRMAVLAVSLSWLQRFQRLLGCPASFVALLPAGKTFATNALPMRTDGPHGSRIMPWFGIVGQGRKSHVVCMGQDPHVIWIGADAVSAVVMDLKSFRDRATKMLVDGAMDHPELASNANDAVVSGTAVPWPFPTWSRQCLRLTDDQACDDLLNSVCHN